MSLVHGKEISAKEIEEIVSNRLTPTQFASLCNTLIWASTGIKYHEIPSFTERVNDKDGGIDAEWEYEQSIDMEQSGLMKKGWNVYQFKKRDIFAQDRETIFKGLKSGVKGEIKSIYERTQKRPTYYVLFTNIDLSHKTKAKGGSKPQKKKLSESLLDGFDSPNDIAIEIIGAAELASILNSFPHIRSAYFSTANFETWRKYQERHIIEKEGVFGKQTKIVGRDDILQKIRYYVDNPDIKAIIIYGPHTIGKTRITIEATSHRPLDTIVALDPLKLTTSDIIYLTSPNSDIILIIEDPDPYNLEDITSSVLSQKGIKLLITIPTSEDIPVINFGKDKRIVHLPIGPLNNEDASKLLRSTRKDIDYSLESWIVNQAGGNPGIILMAANLGDELRNKTSNFVSDISSAFEKKIKMELGGESLDVLKLLSILTHVGVKGKAQKEIELICKVFGDGINKTKVLNYITSLKNSGVLRETGSYVEIVPPIFGNYLLVKSLSGRYHHISHLLVALSRDGAIRFINRLRQVESSEIEQFWGEIFSDKGLFGNFNSALENAHLLRVITSATPDRVAHLIIPEIKKISIEQLFLIRNNERRELVWTLEELLYRNKTSYEALECMFLLALAENEKDIANNATGIFSECFNPHHPQLPLDLEVRLQLIKNILLSTTRLEEKLIGLKAIETALVGLGTFILHSSDSAYPYDSSPIITYGELWDYKEGMMNLLFEVVLNSKEDVVIQRACDIIPKALSSCINELRPQSWINNFNRIEELVIKQNIPISIAELSDSLEHFHKGLKKSKDKVSFNQKVEYDKYLNQVEELINRFNKDDFNMRFKKWLGGWSHDTNKYKIEVNGEIIEIYRDIKEIYELIVEIINNPDLLSDELFQWLLYSKPAQVESYFYWLGRLDHEEYWLEKIRNTGDKEYGIKIYGAYFGAYSG